MSAILGILVVTFSVVHGVLLAELSPVVTTTEGRVQGILADDGDYYSYYGIRYAGDPSGVNRFKAPVAPPVYTDIFSATEKDVLCPQPRSPFSNGSVIIGIEDCLRLSIFTPRVASDNPVLVWLVGEDYTNSNPLEHSFQRWTKENFTVVAVNYRLSVLGFLCLGIEEAPGNAGLKDVVQALKWIQSNIKSFGGDPSNVLLFGHGSGAAMADLITMSPLAEGLVHRVIAQSGSALAPWAMAYSPENVAVRLGIILEYTGTDRKELVQTLISADFSLLITFAEYGMSTPPNTVLFAPCIENERTQNRFLTDAPIRLLRSGNYMHIPFIGAYVDREGSARLFESGVWINRMENSFDEFIPQDLQITDDIVTSIRSFYYGNETISRNNIEKYIDFHGDILTLLPVIKGAIERSKTSKAEVRLLEFAVRVLKNLAPFEVDLAGTGHGEILRYLLDVDLTSEEEESFMNSLVGRYVNFATTGQPSSNDNYISWSSMQPPQYVQTLRISGFIDETIPGIINVQKGETMMENPQGIKRDFWDPIYEAFYVYPPGNGASAVNFTALFLILSLSLTHFVKSL